jgi:anti-sigma factor RsiW
MKMNPDDPRLTAYALGELDAAQRKAIEADLANATECRLEVEEIARTAAWLAAELAAEPLPGLTYAQQMAIEAKLEPGSAKAEAPKRSLLGALRETNLLGRAAVCAGVAVVFVALIAVPWYVTHRPTNPGRASSPIAETAKRVQSVGQASSLPPHPSPSIAETVKRVQSGGAEESDAAFERWAAPYRGLQIPLVPLEEAANYTPPEIRPVQPAPAIGNGKS